MLDWNNNYGDEDDKCILFHCGPMPASMMEGLGHITDHPILMNAVGEGNGYGCNVGRIRPMDFTFGSLMTDEGRVKMYLGEGRITRDPVRRISLAWRAWRKSAICRMCCCTSA